MVESLQKLLLRNRPPRVRITYDVEIGDAIESKELPLVMGIISDLYGHQDVRQDYKSRKFITIDRDNFAEVMGSIKPILNLNVRNIIESDSSEDQKGKQDQTVNEAKKLAISLVFNSIDDFSPINIVMQVPAIQTLFYDRTNLVDLATKADANEKLNDIICSIIKDDAAIQKLLKEAQDLTKASPEIDKIIYDSELIKKADDSTKTQDTQSAKDTKDAKKNPVVDDAELNKYRKMIASFARNCSVVISEIRISYPYFMNLIAQLDAKLSAQLDEILHASDFQNLEASWRGLHYLVMNSETGEGLKIKLFCAGRQELQNDLEKAIEFDQSILFKRIYEEEFGTLGGEPYSCLVADFYVGRKAIDVSFITKLTQVAAAAHAPLLISSRPDLFDIESFTQIGAPRDLKKIFENSELIAWNSFRDMEDARYCNVFLPRILVRLPYGEDTIPVQEFNYNETVDGMDNSKFCWGNPAYAMALRITTAFAKYGWCAAIRGVEGGGLVENLPAYTFKTPYGDIALKCPTEVVITDRREKEASDLGFISLCHYKGTDKAVFFSAQSVQKPKKYDLPEATANAAISARLTYMLNVSRFAHYIKMLMRDKIGSFASKDDIKLYLNNWIANYVFLSDQGSQEAKSRYPLREASIEIADVEGNPGEYKAILFLRPHFQLEELEVSLRLVATLPKAGS
ncbi:MAG: type VI secretion system contractile sheath large subunit [Alphaproteobacteria bacterium]|nr:MAG: type VI secretion system contractile sheath large subunit [Alphaproteobacteria bacterium]